MLFKPSPLFSALEGPPHDAADEGTLFQIANKFDLRHRDTSQRSHYDPVFLDWIFWWYLATIELTNRIITREQDNLQPCQT